MARFTISTVFMGIIIKIMKQFKEIKGRKKSLAFGGGNMFQTVFFVFLRTAAAYILLMIIVRLLGRKAISQMTLFDFALAITLGSLTSHVSLSGDESPASTITALITLGTLGVLTDFIHIKSFRMRKLINSEPVILIEKGHIVKENMVKTRITLTELTSMLRTKSIFNISDVNYAIMENSGKLSVLLKANKMPLNPSDMQLNPSEKGLTSDIIIDGKIMRENLKFTSLTEVQLLDQLKSMGINNAEEVFYAGLDSSGQLYVSKGTMGKEQEGEHGIE